MSVCLNTIYREPGRFAGWPANYGLWNFGPEILSLFVVGWVAPQDGLHPRNTARPFQVVQARSLDGGETWSTEPFSGVIPTGAVTLSGDEHVNDELKVGPKLREEHFVPLDSPVDFLDPETLVLCARTDLTQGSSSWFYVSTDRGRHWTGPHRLPQFDLLGTSARTDIVPLSAHSALFMLTAAKTDGTEGRVFSARTDDGGKTFRFLSFMRDEPEGWMIMPSSVSCEDGSVITAVRCAGPADGQDSQWRNWIDVYRSLDEGASWAFLARAVEDTGHGGNPPALVRLQDGRLVLTYGFRDAPRAIRACMSQDGGASWSSPQTLTDEAATHDMGYPKAVVLENGEVFLAYYSNTGPLSERSIESVRWRP